MSSETITSVAHDVVAINRTTALKAVEAQCKGALRLIDAPISLYGKSREKLNFGTPLCKVADNLNGLAPQARHQSEVLLENYARAAAKLIDWATERAESGISKIDETLLSRGGPAVNRALLPGMGLLRRMAEQTASLTERAADFVAAEAGPAVVSETKKATSKAKASAKEAHHAGHHQAAHH